MSQPVRVPTRRGRPIPRLAMTGSERVPHPWRPARFMLIVAHPDDADFGPAATAARWIDEGSVGWLVCCTSGDQGGEDPDIDPLELAALREAEQRAAAEIVGYEGVTFLHQPDGALANDLALRELLVREIRTFRPDAVLATDPDVVIYRDGGINHTDHRAAGIAAIDAVYPAARNPMAFPWLARSGLAAHNVRRVYLFWPNQPDVWVDVSTTLDRKIAALRAHESQIKHPERLEERIRAWAKEEGEAVGVEAAEALRAVVIDEDEDDAEGPTHTDEAPTEEPGPTHEHAHSAADASG
jgi:LmbE family N-acetylglucosaminyl deacetylase